MKLLLVVFFIATASIPANGITMKQLTTPDLAFRYELILRPHANPSGYFQFKSVPNYVSTVDGITILFKTEVLLRGVGIFGSDAENVIIKYGEAKNLGSGVKEMSVDTFHFDARHATKHPTIEFLLNTYLLGLPESVKLGDGVKVEVIAERISGEDSGEDTKKLEGFVVLLNKVNYVMVSKLTVGKYGDLTIFIPGNSKPIYKFEKTYAKEGPFVALPIKVEN